MRSAGAVNQMPSKLTPVCLQVVRSTIEEFDRDGDHALNLAEFKTLVHTVEIQNKLALSMA